MGWDEGVWMFRHVDMMWKGLGSRDSCCSATRVQFEVKVEKSNV